MTDTNNLGFFKKSATAGIPYFHIFDGSICQKSKVEIDGWEGPIPTQHPSTKKTVHTWVMRYDSIAVYVIDANRFKKEFTAEQGGGKAAGIDLTLQAGTMRAVLTLKIGQNGPDPVLKRFLKVAPNVDFDKPLLISAFKNREGKQAVSFRQGEDPDPQKWTKVEEYWRRPLGPDGKVDMSKPSVGADGSVLPEPVHDEFNDSWDYNPQNTFLLKYYLNNIEPKLKAIAQQHNLTQGPMVTEAHETTDDDGFPTHTGGGSAPIPVVTVKPENVTATSVADAATGEQRAKIRQLATQANFDFEAQCQNVMGCAFDDLNREAASFAVYKLGQMIAAQGQPAPAQKAVMEMAVPPPAPVAPVPAPEPEPQLSDDWGTADTPAGVPDIPWDN
jgi:hypothetical protein